MLGALVDILIWAVVGGVIGGVWAWSAVVCEKREYRRRTPQAMQRSAEEVFIDMRERKHDTMRRMRQVARDHKEGRY